MPQENVEIVRRMYDAWNRRDEDAMLTLSDPEVEFVNSPTAICHSESRSRLPG